MPRWPILRTLLYKEVLRYRYNWGLLVMIAALLAMSALISISARMNQLPGQGDTEVNQCVLMYHGGSRSGQEWQEHLWQHRPDLGVFFRKGAYGDAAEYERMIEERHVPPKVLVIQLVTPRGDQPAALAAQSGPWKARYWYDPKSAEGVLPLRDWLAAETRRFLDIRPAIEEESRPTAADDTRVPLVITALTIFALYLLSFNLYLTSSGEEREKRVLLGLLLSPASPAEFILAKAIFYVTGSLVVSLAVVSMYEPRLLAQPLLWSAIISGSLGYVAIGTVFLTLVRRQTTISIVSMLYLLVTSMIMFLSQFLPLFVWLRRVLVEDYLYRQLQLIIAQQPVWLLGLYANQLVLALLVLAWGVAAIEVFRRQGMAIARGR